MVKSPLTHTDVIEYLIASKQPVEENISAMLIKRISLHLLNSQRNSFSLITRDNLKISQATYNTPQSN